MTSVTLLVAISSEVFSTAATGTGNPDEAKSIVVEHCGKCHAVPGYGPDGAPESIDAPSIKWMARNPELYPEPRLRQFLRRPHYPMRGIFLSDTDIENIITVIESLR
ncbi:MAG: cytochrome c [Acidiferrobacterales bacterium]